MMDKIKQLTEGSDSSEALQLAILEFLELKEVLTAGVMEKIRKITGEKEPNKALQAAILGYFNLKEKEEKK